MLIIHAFQDWKDSIRPAIVEEYGEDDMPAMAESWNNYTDALQKDGELTALQYQHAPAFDDEMPGGEYGDATDEIRYLLDAMGFKSQARQIPSRTDATSADQWGDSARHFIIGLQRGKIVMRFQYSMGSALTGNPDLSDLMHCMLTDAVGISYTESFGEWADDMGIDSDIAKWERVYNASKAQTESFRKMITVSEFEDLQTAFEDY